MDPYRPRQWNMKNRDAFLVFGMGLTNDIEYSSWELRVVFGLCLHTIIVYAWLTWFSTWIVRLVLDVDYYSACGFGSLKQMILPCYHHKSTWGSHCVEKNVLCFAFLFQTSWRTVEIAIWLRKSWKLIFSWNVNKYSIKFPFYISWVWLARGVIDCRG